MLGKKRHGTKARNDYVVPPRLKGGRESCRTRVYRKEEEKKNYKS